MKKVLLLLLLPAVLSAYTPEEKQTILKALKLYQALNSGNYVIKTEKVEISGSKQILHRALIAAGQRYKFKVTLPVYRIENKNSAGVSAGSGCSIWYSRSFGKIFILKITGLYWNGSPGIQAGAGVKF